MSANRQSKIDPEHVQEAAVLRQLWDKYRPKMSQAEFGEQFGIGGQSAVANFLHGRSPLSLKAASGFSRGLGVPIADFSPRLAVQADDVAAAVSSMRSRRVEAIDMDVHPDLDPVRVVKLRLQAGITGFAVDLDDTDAPPIFFRSDWLRRRGFKPYDLIATRVGGQSMEPTLYHDDVVVIHVKETEPKDGEVYSINYEGEALIKRLVRDGGGWELASDNSDKVRYPNKRWVDGNAIIIGRIVHRQSERI